MCAFPCSCATRWNAARAVAHLAHFRGAEEHSGPADWQGR
jgi:hypothetical protein